MDYNETRKVIAFRVLLFIVQEVLWLSLLQ